MTVPTSRSRLTQAQANRRRLIIGTAVSCAVPLVARASPDHIEIVGAGASLPALVYEKWGQQFTKTTGIAFRYAALGSGQSLRLMTQGRINFGASEIPHQGRLLTNEGLIEFPVANAAIVLVANLPGVLSNQIRLTPSLISKIYIGTIRHWRDPAILNLNKQIEIPDLSITPVSRFDRSGSTFELTRFLSETDRAWQKAVGVSSEAVWNYGLLAKGTSALQIVVERTPGAIGYTVTGRRLSSGSSMLALSDATTELIAAPDTTSNAGNWPLATTTYAILPSVRSGPAEHAAFEFFRLGISQWQDLTRQAGLAPLTNEQQQSVLKIWQQNGLIT